MLKQGNELVVRLQGTVECLSLPYEFHVSASDTNVLNIKILYFERFVCLSTTQINSYGSRS